MQNSLTQTDVLLSPGQEVISGQSIVHGVGGESSHSEERGVADVATPSSLVLAVIQLRVARDHLKYWLLKGFILIYRGKT